MIKTNKLPEKFYEYVSDYYTEQVLRGPSKSMPSTEEQVAWFNKEFPEADWVGHSNNTITPEFKSPKLETFFMLKWS